MAETKTSTTKKTAVKTIDPKTGKVKTVGTTKKASTAKKSTTTKKTTTAKKPAATKKTTTTKKATPAKKSTTTKKTTPTKTTTSKTSTTKKSTTPKTTTKKEVIKKEETKVDETIKVEPVKEEPKKVEPKKEEPKKEEPKKEEPKKEEPTKKEPKKEELKKVEPKKEEPKKEEPKKEEPVKKTRKRLSSKELTIEPEKKEPVPIVRPTPKKTKALTKEEKAQYKLLEEAYTYVATLSTVIEDRTMDRKQITDLTIGEIHVIETVSKHNNKPMSLIAECEKITVGALTICVNRLVQKGYLLRIRDEMDHRVILLSVTQKGKKILKIHEKFRNDIIGLTLENVTLSQASKVMQAFAHTLAVYDDPTLLNQPEPKTRRRTTKK